MTTNFRLGTMMFLQFFVWGGWYVTVGNFMVAEGMGTITHWAYSVSPLAAIISPFFLGFVADRYFNAEKVLGILHILSGCFLLLTPFCLTCEISKIQCFYFVISRRCGDANSDRHMFRLQNTSLMP